MITKSTIIIFGIFICTNVTAELKKLRNWPAVFPSNSQELREQYEFDPAAGGVSDKLISYTVHTTSPQGTWNRQTIYKNGIPVSGSDGWEYGSFKVYHGFAVINGKPGNTVQSINYTETTPWPTREFKLLTTDYDTTSQSTTKSLLHCKQLNSYSATKISTELPGTIYKYNCDLNVGTKITNLQGVTLEDGSPTVRYDIYYSDYLNTPIMTIGDKTSPVHMWKDMHTSVSIEFINLNNTPSILSLRDDQL